MLINQKNYLENIENDCITSNLSKNELIERESKVSRFTIDYCRASPNIDLKQKKPISIGWRNTKFHFDVQIELTNSLNFSTENVINLYNFLF